MSPRLRALITSGVVLAVVFSAGLAGGFVYGHEPQRDVLSIALDRRPLPTSERVVSGTIVATRDGVVVLSGEGGTVEVALPSGVPIEELRRAEDGLPSGARVNLGVEQTASGLVLTGIVSIEEPAP
jgi:hypothetical protein